MKGFAIGPDPLNNEPADTSNEEWKTLTRYPRYEVSSLGRVRNTDTKKLIWKQRDFNKNRIFVYEIKGRYKNSLVLNIIIAETFLTNPDNKTDVLNINHDKDNAEASNLLWCTREQRLYHEKHPSHVPTIPEVR